MPLSWNEIRDRAQAFSTRWKDAVSEQAQSQHFWIEFFHIFDVDPKRVSMFEKRVKLSRAGERLKEGRIDLFWPGTLLVEMKSPGQDLDRAFAQAGDYFDALPKRDLPRYILVSDFRTFRLYDLKEGIDHPPFALTRLRDKVRLFGFIAGYNIQTIRPQDPVNLHAAEQMGRLHDLLKASGYTGHPLELLLVRLLFCLFADDTGIFTPAQAFRAWLDERTAEDGTDLGPRLAQLFQVLNQPEFARPTALDEQLRAFPFVNGKLFEEALPIAAFDATMRDTLLDCCALDWSAISPAVFGALFQSIMDARTRRNLGAHYTSEENILKLIKPLFLDDLWSEFQRVRSNRNRLFDFHKRLRTLAFLDPACGCGNFLVISYRELRKLELEILRVSLELERATGQRLVDVQQLVSVNVDQFHGIEIEEFPAQIAQVAMWLVDHQMNTQISEEFGNYYARIPLISTPHIVRGNSLELDWNAVLPRERCTYILGNPPFGGSKLLSDAQRAEMRAVVGQIPNGGNLDYVAAWYVLAARYMKGAPIRAALVSTNSISQGEQPGILWNWLLGRGIRIAFAHRTFQWSNEARGVAAVHCVIIGFGYVEPAKRTIFEYDDIRGEPHAIAATNINPYLVDAPDITLPSRQHPICDVPEIGIGNKPIDDGNYLFTTDERDAFVAREPMAARYFQPWIGADELLNGYRRWCLDLRNASPVELRSMPAVLRRVEAVKAFRETSKSEPTRKLAQTPTRFHVESVARDRLLVVPRHSSERRHIVPMGYFGSDAVVGDACLCIADATPFHFGVLSSTMHNAWIRYTCGRLESRYRYSKDIVYNNFPWPEQPTDAQRRKVETAAQGVLDARAAHPAASLADLYDPLTMPPNLVKAHQALDAAVDAAYGRSSFKSDAERIAFLFDLYRKCTTLLPAPTRTPARTRRPRGIAAT
jgi:hypothetical protein